MASSSSFSCFHCHVTNPNPNHFRNGWRLHSGDYAPLCLRCASVHEQGRFCETFHSDHDGWRDCESCKKFVHCGCIVSFSSHSLLDSGGIICTDCSRNNLLLQARKRCMPLEPETRASKPSSTPSEHALTKFQFLPGVTLLAQQLNPRNQMSATRPMTLLFEKELSVCDADLKYSRLILPKRYAEEFFPDISGLPGSLIKMRDIEGHTWEFIYRHALDDGNWIYVLEGLRDHMLSKNWQPGDTVMFYRVEPKGELVIGLRKTSAAKQVAKAREPTTMHTFNIRNHQLNLA